MTHGPGTLAGRVPVTVSVFPPGSVTVKVFAFTWTWRPLHQIDLPVRAA